MAREVLINAGAGEIRVALMADGRLEELAFERTIGGEDGARGCHSLVGEIMVLALLSLPFAALFGTAMAVWLTRLFGTENFAFPFVFNPPGYAFAMTFTLICVLTAAMIVRSSVDRLDLVGVLKAR